MRKILSIALLCLMLCTSTAYAESFWTGSVWNNDLSAFVPNVMVFDWSPSGSGVATGMGPVGAPLVVGTTFDFLYQANLVVLSDPDGNTITFPGLNTSFEYTVVATIPEVVSSVTSISGVVLANFTTLPGGTFYMYNDTVVDADVATGAGFDDGTLVSSGTINPGQISSFTQFLSGLGGGFILLQGLVNFADPLFLDPAIEIIDFGFVGTLNYPPRDSTTTAFFLNPPTHGGDNYPTYIVTANDIPLRVDGGSNFSVPEPSTLVLLGAGLIGLGGLARKRIKK